MIEIVVGIIALIIFVAAVGAALNPATWRRIDREEREEYERQAQQPTQFEADIAEQNRMLHGIESDGKGGWRKV